MNNLEAIWWET
jgi:hypothetical protein